MNQTDVNIAIFCGFFLFFILALFIIYFVLVYHRNQSLHTLEKQQLELHFENEISRAQLEMNEYILQRISTEIHDNIGQSLTLASFNLLDMQSDDSALLLSTRELVSRSLSDLRDLSKSLNHTYQLDLGLSNAIKRELKLIGERGSISWSMEPKLLKDSISLQTNFNAEERDIILFRCFQEAVSNILKYADATHIQVVTFFCRDICYGLFVSDNGQGMDLSTVKLGMGLKSMEKRMQLIGGRFEIESQLKVGTKLGFSISKNSIDELMELVS